MTRDTLANIPSSPFLEAKRPPTVSARRMLVPRPTPRPTPRPAPGPTPAQNVEQMAQQIRALELSNAAYKSVGRVLLRTQEKLVESERECQLAQSDKAEMQRLLTANRKLLARLIQERNQRAALDPAAELVQARLELKASQQEKLQLGFAVQDLQRRLIELECQGQLDQQALQGARTRLDQLLDTQDNLLEVLEAERQEIRSLVAERQLLWEALQ